MPIELCELVEAVDEVQHQENDAEQHDAAADETMAQIAEQLDRRFVARYMGAGRYDQRPDNQLFDVGEYFLGDRLDMFGVERQLSGSDLRHKIFLELSLRFPCNDKYELHYSGSAIKKQEGRPSCPSTIGRINEGENRCYAPS